jgi:hypothetical protein
MRILCAPAPGRIVIAVLPPGFVTPGALTARHVGVAPSIVNNNPETMERSRRSFPTAASGPYFQAPPSRSRSRIYPTSADLKCRTRASPSWGGAVTITALAGPISRCQTAHLVPAARFCARGFAPLLRSPRIEGWAERRETFGCVRSTRGAYHDAIRQVLARRPAFHDAGRSPLGAPPWRFFTRAALPSPAVPPDP